jgi:D-amino peptidase
VKLYIFADMEGISGISGSNFILPDGNLYNEGRKYLTSDVNACIKGCLATGVSDIVVRDGHSYGRHIIWEQLHPAAKLYQGESTFGQRFPEIENCDAIIFIGYHAMAGAANAFLEHTYSSKGVQNLWLNEQKVGEFGLDSAIASEYGVPTIMVSGDDKVCSEAKLFNPDVVTCQVKKGGNIEGVLLESRDKAHQLIENKTIEAIKQIDSIKLPEIDYPIKLRKEAIERVHPKLSDDVNIISPRITEIECNSVEKAFFKIF